MNQVNKSLQKVLGINASFSAISASSILFFPEGISSAMGLSSAHELKQIAWGLVFFSIWVAFVALRKSTNTAWVKLIIVQDLLWVLGSVLILLIQPWGLNNFGLELLAIVAMVVSVFAGLQFLKL